MGRPGFAVSGRIDPDVTRQLRWRWQPSHEAFRVLLVEGCQYRLPFLVNDLVDDGSTSAAAQKNPFSGPSLLNIPGTFQISYKEQSHVVLRIYSVHGKLVRTLVDERLDPERYDILWDGLDSAGNQVASGVLFLQVYG